MAWFSPPEFQKNITCLKRRRQQLADELKVPVLGRIPIVESIREGGDTGNPVMLDQTNPVQRPKITLSLQPGISPSEMKNCNPPKVDIKYT